MLHLLIAASSSEEINDMAQNLKWLVYWPHSVVQSGSSPGCCNTCLKTAGLISTHALNSRHISTVDA